MKIDNGLRRVYRKITTSKETNRTKWDSLFFFHRSGNRRRLPVSFKMSCSGKSGNILAHKERFKVHISLKPYDGVIILLHTAVIYCVISQGENYHNEHNATNIFI